MDILLIASIAIVGWFLFRIVKGLHDGQHPDDPSGASARSTKPPERCPDDVDVEDFILHDEVNPDDDADVGGPP